MVNVRRSKSALKNAAAGREIYDTVFSGIIVYICNPYPICIPCPAYKRLPCLFYCNRRDEPFKCRFIRFTDRRILPMDCRLSSADRQDRTIRLSGSCRIFHPFYCVPVRDKYRYTKVPKRRSGVNSQPFTLPAYPKSTSHSPIQHHLSCSKKCIPLQA